MAKQRYGYSFMMDYSQNPETYGNDDVAPYSAVDLPAGSVYLTSPRNRLRQANSTEISGIRSASAAASAIPWNGFDRLNTINLDLAGKRSGEALYHQSILGTHNSEALYSTNYSGKRPKLEYASTLPVYPQRPGEKDCAYYMRTRTCKFGVSCKFDHPLWVPEDGIPDWKEIPFATSGEVLPQRPEEPDCPYYMKTQTCKFGEKCKFNHPKDIIKGFVGGIGEGYHKGDKDAEQQIVSVPNPPAFMHNSKGLPVRPGESDCSFYKKTGSCKYGPNCRYNHPDRYLSNPDLAASIGPSYTPSTGAANLSLEFLSSTANILPNNAAFAPQSIAIAPEIYPQRPGEIECDYYMKTGKCKYGEYCKFHHPIDRPAAALTAAKPVEQNVRLTLAGLPRREGALSCSYYMKTGACKFGSNCKFDHPPPGEAIAMATKQTTGTGAETTSGDI